MNRPSVELAAGLLAGYALSQLSDFLRELLQEPNVLADGVLQQTHQHPERVVRAGFDRGDVARTRSDLVPDAVNNAAISGRRHATPPTSVTGTPEGTAPAEDSPSAGPFTNDGTSMLDAVRTVDGRVCPICARLGITDSPR